MVAVATIVGAIARSAWRSLNATKLLGGNNLTAMIVLMMAEEPGDRPSSTAVWYLIVGLLYAVPMGQRLTEQIPAIRLRLWPLSLTQTTAVYLVSIVLNPIFPLAILFTLLSRHPAVGSGMFVAGAVAPLLVLARPGSLHVLRAVPSFPGRLGGLIQSYLREILQTLDVPLAALLAFGGFLYRMLGSDVDPYAAVVLAPMLVLVLSTLAQAHLQFDGGAMRTRARLLPIAGWELLISRDAAWFLVVLAVGMTYPLAPLLCAALAAAAVGHHTVMEPAAEQRRWQFGSGRLAPTGLIQILALIVAAVTAHNFGWLVLVPSVLAYGLSLWWYGRRWDSG